MINLLKKITLLLTFIALSTSCSKDDEPVVAPITYDIKGYYQGTLGVGDSDTGFPIAMVIEENNKITFVYNNAKLYGAISNRIGFGTYSFVNNTLIANNIKMNLGTGELVTLNLTFNPTTAKLSGTWVGSVESGKMAINKNITGKDNITGYWTNSQSTTYGTSKMIIEADGTYTFISNSSVTNALASDFRYGTYTLTNGVFTSTHSIDQLTYYIKYTFDSANGKLINGIWGYTINYEGPGILTGNKLYY